MSDSVKNKIGYFIFVVIVGVLFGIGPFHGGHDLLKISIASPSSSVIKSVEKKHYDVYDNNSSADNDTRDNSGNLYPDNVDSDNDEYLSNDMNYYNSVSEPVETNTHYSQPCRVCNSTGRCRVCDGKGLTHTKRVYNYDLNCYDLADEPCRTCEGNGYCNACHGDGLYEEGADF